MTRGPSGAAQPRDGADPAGSEPPTGGWNCEVENGSVRSSFDTTIDVLDGLREFERATGGSAVVREARRGGEQYLLERGLFRRKTTGEIVDPGYLDCAFPYYWHQGVLRAFDYFRRAGADPDPAMAEAVEVVRSKRRRPVAARPYSSGSRPLRPRGWRRSAQSVEHPARAPGARQVGPRGGRGDVAPQPRRAGASFTHRVEASHGSSTPWPRIATVAGHGVGGDGGEDHRPGYEQAPEAARRAHTRPGATVTTRIVIIHRSAAV